PSSRRLSRRSSASRQLASAVFRSSVTVISPKKSNRLRKPNNQFFVRPGVPPRVNTVNTSEHNPETSLREARNLKRSGIVFTRVHNTLCMQPDPAPEASLAAAFTFEPLVPNPGIEIRAGHQLVTTPGVVGFQQKRRLYTQLGVHLAALGNELGHGVLLDAVVRRGLAHLVRLGQAAALPVKAAPDGPRQYAGQIGLQLLQQGRILLVVAGRDGARHEFDPPPRLVVGAADHGRSGRG